MRNTYQAELEGIGVSGSNVDLKTQRLPNTKLLVLQRVSVTNETSGGDTATIGVDLGGKILWLETLTITTAGLYYALKEPVYIEGAKQIIVRFVGTTTADKLKAFLFGYYTSK
jgi:hypothetical protein